MSCTGVNCPVQHSKVDPTVCKVDCCPWRTEKKDDLMDSVLQLYKNIGYLEGYNAAMKELFRKGGKGRD